MDPYTLSRLIGILTGIFNPKVALTIVALVAVIIAVKKSVGWAAQEVVRLLGEWVRSQTEERLALMRQNQTYAAEIQTHMHNHLAHQERRDGEHRADMAARDLVLAGVRDSLVKLSTTQDELLKVVQSHRAEDQRRAEAAS